MVDIKFKKLHEDAVIPKVATGGSAGMDLTAVSVDSSWTRASYDTGLAVEIPEGHVGLLFPRSSIFNLPLRLANSVGVIDSDYRGPLILNFDRDLNVSHFENDYKVGDRIGQLVIVPIVISNPVEADELSDTSRGEGGFGSTGK